VNDDPNMRQQCRRKRLPATRIAVPTKNTASSCDGAIRHADLGETKNAKNDAIDCPMRMTLRDFESVAVCCRFARRTIANSGA
jgi:hypothetical protein